MGDKRYIYTLDDPRDGRVRYVGRTKDLKKRLKGHCNPARYRDTPVFNWIKDLRELGLKPVMTEIDLENENDYFLEKYWAHQFKAWGFDLLNYGIQNDGHSIGNDTSFRSEDNKKRVVIYNKEFQIVNTFDSAYSACKFFKLNHRSLVANVCNLNNKAKTFNDLTGFYCDDIKGMTQYEINNLLKQRYKRKCLPNKGSFKKGHNPVNKKPIIMSSIDDTIIMNFNSISSAAKYIGVTPSAINYACTKSKRNTCKGYKFYLKNDR